MKILIRRLPRDTHSSQVKALVLDALPKSLFFGLKSPEKPEILECKQYRVTDPSTGHSEQWCMLRVRPEGTAAQVVKKLNGLDFGAQRLSVKQFLDRGPTDRRKAKMSPEERMGLTGRSERRRGLIIEPIEEPKVEAYESFARTFAT